MIDPIGISRSAPAGPAVDPAARTGEVRKGGAGFATQLREQLEHVSRMQAEADERIQNLLTGQSDNVSEVFTAARKAEVAFSLMMEIRNKLVDAYGELKQLRV